MTLMAQGCGVSLSGSQGQTLIDNIIGGVTGGRGGLAGIKTSITEAHSFVDGIVNTLVTRNLQEDLFALLAKNPFLDPTTAFRDLNRLKRRYGAAAIAPLAQVEAFLRDPVNTSLDICKDIQNIKKVGTDEARVYPKNSRMPEMDSKPDMDLKDIEKEYNEKFAIEANADEQLLMDQLSGKVRFEVETPVSNAFPGSDIIQETLLAGRLEEYYIAQGMGPELAHQAAISRTRGYEGLPSGTRFEDIGEGMIASPFPTGKIYTPRDFERSRFASAIAEKINTAHPVMRDRIARGVIDYLNTYGLSRDLTITSTYRSVAKQQELYNNRASNPYPVAFPGKSWHNYGLAVDFGVYVNGVYDSGKNGNEEYTGRLRTAMARYGLVNPLVNSPVHFYIGDLGTPVPEIVLRGANIDGYLASVGVGEL